MAIPHSTTGSLEPAFATARLVGLTVKLPYTHALYSPITDRAEGTFVILRYSLGGFAPEKLTCYQCPSPRLWVEVRRLTIKNWYFIFRLSSPLKESFEVSQLCYVLKIKRQ